MEALMNEALERINRQYGIRLMLEKARPGCVFPKVDVMGCFVRFNPKIRSFLTLYNLMLQFPSIDSESVVFSDFTTSIWIAMPIPKRRLR